MDKIKYYECYGDTHNLEYQKQLIRKIDQEVTKNFYSLEDVDKHLDVILDKYIKASGMTDAYLWKSDNWGKPRQWSYWGIHHKVNNRTYILVSGRLELKEIEIY